MATTHNNRDIEFLTFAGSLRKGTAIKLAPESLGMIVCPLDRFDTETPHNFISENNPILASLLQHKGIQFQKRRCIN